MMEKLVRIDQQPIALLFSDYLKSIHINAHVEADQQSYIVFCQADKTEQAMAVFEKFIKQPYHPIYQQAAWQHGESHENIELPRSSFPSITQKFMAHAGVLTLSIFFACWAVYLLAMFGLGNEVYGFFQFYHQLSLANVISEPQRIIGPILLHFSLLHIAFNTMWWWQLGGDIERVFGKLTLLNLLLISALFSNVGQFLVSGANFGGLSGVVYAVVGFVWWMGWLAPEKGLGLSRSLIGFLLFWLVLGYVDVLPVNMANTAHLLGLISGCLLAVWQVKITKNTAK